MAPKEQLTPAKHREQIEAYVKERPRYVTYAKVLERVFREACRISFPEALVQSRPKGVSSFAEKVVRKFDRYPDAVHQMTDLCGARVIVQTTEQVRAVRQFIEANFEIVEQDDKGLLLSEDKFGYRDMHYIIQLRSDRDALLGVTAEEHKEIGERKAEVQVRTWVQHAWADTLHDRIYKNKLKVSPDIRRTGALLAALMEEGDRRFNYLADELDGLIANYTAFAAKDEVQNEIKTQELILANEPDENRKAGLALNLARLLAACGDHVRVVELLEPHSCVPDGLRCELLLTLGYSLCRQHRDDPSSAEYQRGLTLLEESGNLCGCGAVPFVPHLRRRESLHARALVRLGWALEPLSGREYEALECYYEAHEHEPANPYYLADMLGFEMYCGRASERPASMRTTIREAIKTCRDHVLAGIEMPYACFTAGRLSLLLGEADDALGYYARGIRYCLAGVYCVPADAMALEIEWLKRIHFGRKAPPEFQDAIELLGLGNAIANGSCPSGARAVLQSPVLIVSGGAASMSPASLDATRPLLEAALVDFHGTVVSGGTTVGVPGLVGDIAGEFAVRNWKHFRLVGYLPGRLPHGVSPHGKYDECVNVGDDFRPEQILRNWTDILAAGVDPRSVLLLGFGGGPLSAVEYRLALGLGASVGIFPGTGDAAEEITKDLLWSTLPNLYPLPMDAMTARAFLFPSAPALDKSVLEEMAKEFHARYVAGNTRDLPEKLKPWDKLKDTFKRANFEQASHVVQILETAGFGIRQAEDPVVFNQKEFSSEEVELMAELEHGRWNVERLRDGWRLGSRDDEKKLHNCLVPWDELPDGPGGVRKYDRNAVRDFPEILAKAGLEVYRPGKSALSKTDKPSA